MMEKIATVQQTATPANLPNATAIVMPENMNSNNENVVSSPTPINLHDTMLACSKIEIGTANIADNDVSGRNNETNTMSVACTLPNDNDVSLPYNNYSSSSSSRDTTSNVAASVVDKIIDGGVEPQLKSENNSVNEQTSSRSNFKKSNTCGSLFAKCACGNHYYTNSYNPYNTIATTTPTSPKSITEFSFNEPIVDESRHQISSGGPKTRRIVQSFSHPDATNIIFTDKNKLPKCRSTASVIQFSDTNNESLNVTVTTSPSTSRKSYICTKTGIEVLRNKRQSSPNIDISHDSSALTQYDIAFHHPDFLVQKVYQKNNRPKIFVKQRSVDSFTLPVSTICSKSGNSTLSVSNISNKKWLKNTKNNLTNFNNNSYAKVNKIVRGFEPFSYSYDSLSPASSVEEVDESIEETDTSTSNTTSSINQSSDSNLNCGLKLNYANIVTTSTEQVKALNSPAVLLDNELNDNSDSCTQKLINKSSKALLNFKTSCSNLENLLNYTDREQFIKESGIFGPTETMGSAISGLFRKQSKNIPLHQEPIDKEQIRKNSLGLMKQISDMRRRSITDDYEYLRNTVIPNLKRELSEYEIKVATLEDDVTSLKSVIQSRDEEILKLKTEIHKLKSVLQQTAAATPITSTDTATINNLPAIVEQLSEQQIEPNANYEEDSKEAQLVGVKRQNTHLPLPQQLVKKQGVSGESCDTARQTATDISIQKYDKDFRSKQLIKDAIMDNDFLKHIDSLQVRELVESMYSREFSTGEYVIREGEVGAHLYVSAEGDFEVIKNGQSLGTMGSGKAFGELAILYNCTRTATIRAITNARVWVLDRRVFQHIMMRTGIQRMEENVSFLKSVSLLKNLSNDVLTKIADVLEVEFYPAGAYIIRQGASGDTFFLISQGTVKVTQRVPGSQVEEEIRILGRGEYFGEQALIKEDKRTANIIAMSPGVECLTLDRDSFVQLIGNFCEEIHVKDYGDSQRIFASKSQVSSTSSFPGESKQEMLDVQLSDLQVVATLGIGGFGRVELVKCEKNGNLRTFALKCLKKKHIVETKQEEHVYNERKIMLSCNTPFICRLYRTYRDSKYVYMLLEACLGGEVWTILRDRGNFDDNTTRFIIACVLEAFDYLHTRGIVYRDLKPENLMLDSNGYVKLVDFGFAKYIGLSNKTWTFCGTPEYVAPEIILNRGHDRAVDCWSLGILIHELLTGTPPFAAPDPMKTYNLILKGIDMIDFPRHMSKTAISLIKRLCRDAPAERLGYQRGGIQEIKKHKWFQGFDWDGLTHLTLTPPIVQSVKSPTDASNFDEFPSKTEVPPDENSGWDRDF